jgi:hypothetical protein
MKSDLSRQTFDPMKHYSSVRMQQGRVQLDADWNEQSDIMAHRIETEALDLIGGCGGPLHGAAFGVLIDATSLDQKEKDWLNSLKLLPLKPGDFLITAGRYYVDGILCENEHPLPFTAQADLPDPSPTIKDKGLYLVYLDVWQRHITALDDLHIREVALGGPDTATRTKTVWQVKLWFAGEKAVGNCLTAFDDFQKLIAPSSGKLSAQTRLESVKDDPCIVSPGAGYRGLENQLYRVEIHSGGELGTATFKWSRHNGSVVTAIESIKDQEVTVHDVGLDSVLGFASDQWVEIIDDGFELNGKPGQLVQIETVDPAKRLITVKSTPTPLSTSGDSGVDPARHPKLRRWDQTGTSAKDTGIKTTADWIELESGLQVRFSDGNYKSGDYWLIPARTATAEAQSGNIEWPKDAENKPLPLPPAGIQHHYCRLALLQWDGTQFTFVEDCRRLFPPVTELTSLFYVSGDGQEAMPSEPLPQLLQVGVFNGHWPVKGAKVRFVAQGNGRVATDKNSLQNVGVGNTLEVTTGADGIASCAWRLESNVTKPSQQLEARLLNANGDPMPPVVRFNGNLSIADQVYYDPKQCGTLQGQTTVQKAIDRLSRLVSLYYVSGDGQEVMPGEPLAPLVVVAANGCGAVKGVKVKFTVVSGSGSVNPPDPVTTDDQGLASCNWTLGPEMGTQQVEAKLVPDANLPLPTVPPTSVRFSANLSAASHVYYDPQKCENLKDVKTVQDAIDKLCRIGGGCAVTVGKGGQYERLDEAINALLNEKQTDICICMLPGDHPVDGLDIAGVDIPNIHLKIEGCGPGTRILVQKEPWICRQLVSFALKDVEIRILNVPNPIRLFQCNEVTLSSCHLMGVTDQGALLTIGDVDRIHLDNNVIDAYLTSSQDSPLKVFEFDSLVTTLFKRFIFDSMAFSREAIGVARQLSEFDAQKQAGYLKGLQSSLDNISDTLSVGELESYHKFDRAMSAEKVDPKLLASRLAGIRDAAVKTWPGAAMVIMDGDANTTFENNEIMGVVSLYGIPGDTELTLDELKNLGDLLKRKGIRLSESTGTLELRGNSLNRLVVADEMIEKMKALLSAGKGELEGLYKLGFFTDNLIEGGRSQFWAKHLTLTSNSFDPMSGNKVEAGTVIGDSAIFMGNQAPGYNPDSTSPNITLRNVSRLDQKAANLMTIDDF